MFKTLSASLILALVSFNLMATENSITISGGGSFTKTKIEKETAKKLNPKANLGINYLRSINDTVAIGVDLQTQIGAGKYDTKLKTTGTTPIEYNLTFKDNIPLIAMVLADVKLLQTDTFSVSAQGGAGIALHMTELKTQKLGVTIKEGTTNKENKIAFAGKAGLVGQYEINDNLAIGLGVHYIYTGQPKLKGATIESPITAKVKNSGIMAAGLNLTYKF